MYSVDKYLTEQKNEIRSRLSSAPILSKKQLIDNCQVGDIFLSDASTKEKLDSDPFLKKWDGFIRFYQNTPFPSSKLIINKDRIIGYGVPVKNENSYLTFNVNNIKDVVPKYQRACLLRFNGKLSKQQINGIVSESVKRLNSSYNTTEPLLSGWNRLVGENFLNSGSDFSKMSESQLRSYSGPLICSSIIALVYKINNVALDLPYKNIYNIWPNDFIESSSFDIVGYYE